MGRIAAIVFVVLTACGGDSDGDTAESETVNTPSTPTTGSGVVPD